MRNVHRQKYYIACAGLDNIIALLLSSAVTRKLKMVPGKSRLFFVAVGLSVTVVIIDKV